MPFGVSKDPPRGPSLNPGPLGAQYEEQWPQDPGSNTHGCVPCGAVLARQEGLFKAICVEVPVVREPRESAMMLAVTDETHPWPDFGPRVNALLFPPFGQGNQRTAGGKYLHKVAGGYGL